MNWVMVIFMFTNGGGFAHHIPFQSERQCNHYAEYIKKEFNYRTYGVFCMKVTD